MHKKIISLTAIFIALVGCANMERPSLLTGIKYSPTTLDANHYLLSGKTSSGVSVEQLKQSWLARAQKLCGTKKTIATPLIEPYSERNFIGAGMTVNVNGYKATGKVSCR